MSGYCNGCEKRCSLDHPQCARGSKMNHDRAQKRRGRGRETEPHHPDEMKRGRRNPAEKPFDHAPHRGHGARPEPMMEPPRARREPHAPSFDHPHPFDRPPRMSAPPMHGHDPRPGGDRFAPHPPEPDFVMRPPHPHPAMPDSGLLRQRVAEAGLAELLRLSGRLMPQGPGGSARGQGLILSILAGRESMSQHGLQQMLGIQPGSVSELVTKLERKGYVSREKSGGRGNVLRITDAGRRAMPQADAEVDPFEPLNQKQRAHLEALLRTLLDRWIGDLPSRT